MVRIGINPLTWTNDDLPALGEENSLEKCLTEARQAGYEGVELGRKFPRDAAVLGPILKNHQLNLVSGWYSGRLLERSVDDEMKAMRAHADLLSKLNSNVMVFCEVSRCVHGDKKVPLSKRPMLGSSIDAPHDPPRRPHLRISRRRVTPRRTVLRGETTEDGTR